MHYLNPSTRFVFGILFLVWLLPLNKIKAQNNIQLLDNQLESTRKSGNQEEEYQVLWQLSQAHEKQAQSSKALAYANQALQVAQTLGKPHLLIQSLERVGVIYSNRGGYDKALIHLRESLKLSRSRISAGQLANKLVIIAKLAMYNQQKQEALQYFEEAYLEIQKTGDKYQIYAVAEELEQAYQKIGNQTQSLKYNAIKAQIAKQLEAEKTEKVTENATQMGKNYQKEITNRESKIYVMQDSLKDAEARQKDAERKSREKDIMLNQQIIISQAKDNELKIKTLEVDKERSIAEYERNIRDSLLISAVLMAVLMLATFYYARISRRKTKEASFLNQKLESKQKDISDSLSYAKRIQEAVMPPKTLINELFPENFVFFKPKDEVSGDFYWAGRKNGFKFVVASDCTGHGIPGAFMSMLGISLINSIILHRGITSPNHILDELSQAIISTLHQENQKNTTKNQPKDGMDIALCAVDEQHDELHFSGAFNSLLMIRSNEHGNAAIVNNQSLVADKIDSEDYHLFQLKADRQPAGIHRRKLEPFTLHTLKLVRGDTIYIFSDGYVDQFGGADNRKFLIKNLKKLLLNIQYMGMTEQHIKLKQELSRWQGDYAQVDDICVIGFRY